MGGRSLSSRTRTPRRRVPWRRDHWPTSASVPGLRSLASTHPDTANPQDRRRRVSRRWSSAPVKSSMTSTSTAPSPSSATACRHCAPSCSLSAGPNGSRSWCSSELLRGVAGRSFGSEVCRSTGLCGERTSGGCCGGGWCWVPGAAAWPCINAGIIFSTERRSSTSALCRDSKSNPVTSTAHPPDAITGGTRSSGSAYCDWPGSCERRRCSWLAAATRRHP
jgi:hypothetical protein